MISLRGSSESPPNDRRRVVSIALALLGVAGLIWKRTYAGPGQDLVRSYAGNVSVSFAVYFILSASSIGARYGNWSAAAVALVSVEAFEMTDGFGIMSNVYDPMDLVANAAGVTLAWVVDAVLRSRVVRRCT